jgi:3-oxoacyl-[acyl-carrier protein] reductase
MTVLEGRVALVTGSARGIGAAIADRLARDGAAVAINYLNSKQEAEAVAERIRKASGNATVIRADIADSAQARSLVESTVKELGRLDILVNNAGITMMAPIEAIDQEQIRRQLTVNVEGPIFALQAAQRYLPSRGRVINITGNVQLHPVPGTSVYAAAKGAIDALTRAWAKELGPRGVTVNAVGPGPTATEAFDAVSNDDLKNLFVARTPLGRIGAPSDIASVVAFLASPDAQWVTGQVLLANGGFTP